MYETSKAGTKESFDPTMLREIIRDVPNFPKEGIMFKDITPLLKHPGAFRYSVDTVSDFLE